MYTMIRAIGVHVRFITSESDVGSMPRETSISLLQMSQTAFSMNWRILYLWRACT